MNLFIFFLGLSLALPPLAASKQGLNLALHSLRKTVRRGDKPPKRPPAVGYFHSARKDISFCGGIAPFTDYPCVVITGLHCLGPEDISPDKNKKPNATYVNPPNSPTWISKVIGFHSDPSKGTVEDFDKTKGPLADLVLAVMHDNVLGKEAKGIPLAERAPKKNESITVMGAETKKEELLTGVLNFEEEKDRGESSKESLTRNQKTLAKSGLGGPTYTLNPRKREGNRFWNKTQVFCAGDSGGPAFNERGELVGTFIIEEVISKRLPM